MNWYTDDSRDRQAEYEHCLRINYANPFIGRIILIVSDGSNPPYNSGRVHIHRCHTRPSYQDIFKIALRISGKHNICILANTDIYFDSTITNVERFDLHRSVLALSRWDVRHGGTAVHYRRSDSQDVWVWGGDVSRIEGLFSTGIAGCDNRIAHLFTESGRKVLNPSEDIRAYHYHLTGKRNYLKDGKRTAVVPPPYHFVIPTSIKNSLAILSQV
jgi:hypothetical protein